MATAVLEWDKITVQRAVQPRMRRLPDGAAQGDRGPMPQHRADVCRSWKLRCYVLPQGEDGSLPDDGHHKESSQYCPSTRPQQDCTDFLLRDIRSFKSKNMTIFKWGEMLKTKPQFYYAPGPVRIHLHEECNWRLWIPSLRSGNVNTGTTNSFLYCICKPSIPTIWVKIVKSSQKS